MAVGDRNGAQAKNPGIPTSCYISLLCKWHLDSTSPFQIVLLRGLC